MTQRSDLFGSVPGFSTATETYENRFRWGREGLGVLIGVQISGAARDAGNSPTTVLRPGLLLGQITASGLLKEYNPTATDGSNLVHSVLMSSFRMQDLDGNNVNRFVWALAAGPIKAASLFGLDNQARAQMARRYLFDDDLQGRLSGNGQAALQEQAKAANYTVTAADAGTLFVATAAVVFTLPALVAGAGPFEFLQTADANMTITAPAGKLVTFNNAAATSAIYSTAGNRIGARAQFAVNAAGTFYYMRNFSPGNTLTVA